MNKLFLPFLSILLLSCNKEKVLTLSDLKFPNPEQEFIQKNKIDTTYTIYPQEDNTEMTYVTYNSAGQVLCEKSMTESVRNHYDDLGFLRTVEFIRPKEIFVDSISYEFDSKNRILTQKWVHLRKGKKTFFDANGRAIESIDLSWPNYREGRCTIYLYKGDQLYRTFFLLNKKDTTYQTDYYYSTNTILDSAVMKKKGNYPQTLRFIYDSVGLLKTRSIDHYKSRTRFVHKKRKSESALNNTQHTPQSTSLRSTARQR